MKIKDFFKKKADGRGDGFVGSVEFREYAIDLYHDDDDMEKCRIEIRCGTQMEVVIGASHEAYGFLLSCFYDGAKDAMEAYVGMLWMSSYLLSADSGFPEAVVSAWSGHVAGLEKQAAEAAEAVTDEQNEADEALMSEAVKIAEMSAEERMAMADKIIDGLKSKQKEKEKQESHE